jgi:F-type H+-transporting ATPase subunit c
MRNIFALIAVVAVLVLSVAPAFAADEPKAGAAAPVATAPAAAAPAAIASYAPLGMGLVILGVGLGLGTIGYAALSGIARQPEQAGTIRTAMLIIGGLVEGAGILALVLCYVAK